MGKKKKQTENKEKKKGSIFSAIVMVVSRFGIRIAIYSLVAVGFFYGITKAYQFGYSMFTAEAMEAGDGTDVLVTIQEDMTDAEIGQLLESKGLVEDRNSFVVQAKLYTGSRVKIYPGTYTLNTAMTPKEMIEVMSVEPETEEESTAFYLGLDEEETVESKAGE